MSSVQGSRALRNLGKSVALAAALSPVAIWAAQPIGPDDKALMTLNAARAAYNDKNYSFAAERYRQFLKEASATGRKEIYSGRYGLGLTLLEGPEKDYNGAVEMLASAAAADVPERPYAQYHLGLAYRGQGVQLLSQASAKPNEAAGLTQQANSKFTQAMQQFAAAAKVFASMGGTPAADAPLPVEKEWASRALCDQAEMLLRLGRAKEVIDLLTPLARDAQFAKSQFRNQGLYLLGYACFNQKDYINGGKYLASLAPFSDPRIGIHARFLLARTHHLAEERPEAAAGYEAVLNGYAAERKAAEGALPAAQTNPAEKQRLEAFLREPVPDYVARAMFHLGEVLYQQSKFADSLARMSAFVQQNPKSPLAPDAQLRAGMSQVRLSQYAEAVNALRQLENHPTLADQALLWMARAQVGLSDTTNMQAYQKSLGEVMAILNRANEKARAARDAGDKEAVARRNEILMELADVQTSARQFKEAAATYARVLGYSTPENSEAVMQKLAVAMQLAGQYRESDEICQRFINQLPKSMLMPEVLFRFAENAYLSAANLPDTPDQANEKKRLYNESIPRYQKLIASFPDSPYAQLAKQSMGTAMYQLGQYDEAIKVLSSIPDNERTGDIATVAYILADCKLRTLPEAADNAIAMARLIRQLKECTYLLNAFLAAQGDSPFAPDAWIKLGYAHQRAAALIADPVEKRNELGQARLAYFHYNEKFTQHPTASVVVFENARVSALSGDAGTAVKLLTQFQQDPYRNSPLAPLAMIRLGDYMRTRSPDQAVAHLAQVRAQYEQQLLKDPAKHEWVAQLQYAHALALKDSGKLPEARAAFDAMVKQFPSRPESGEAAWRLGQIRRDDAMNQLTAAGKAMTAAAGKPAETEAAVKLRNAAIGAMREAANYLKAQSDAIASKAELTDLRVRMLYEAAWVNRTIADIEVDEARTKIVRDLIEKHNQKVGKDGPIPANIPAYRAPDIRRQAIPVQPAEQLVRAQYQTIIDSAPDAQLAIDARFELGDILAQREEYDAAIPLLAEAIDMEPPADMVDRVRLRLGGCFLAKGDAKNASVQFNAILQNSKSYVAAQARYGIGECLMLEKKWAEAIPQLVPFRDNDLMRGVAAAADRALLRLAHAYAQTGQWAPARQTLEVLVQRFPSSPWAHEARYGIGWARQNLKDHDNAVAAYAEVVTRTATELAARAQLQIGVCRMAQKRPQDALAALQVVYYTYDYPELTAAALCEAARAHTELKQTEEAKTLLQRVIQENPQGQWNELAKRLLADIK